MRVVVIMLMVLIWPNASHAQGALVCKDKICVAVEVVSSLEDMKRGLQGREGLKPNHGMLFNFDYEDYQRFWMKDMKFSIDIIWIDSQKKIVTIAPSKAACTQDPCEVYSSTLKAKYVLEVPAGFTKKHKFRQGDQLVFQGIN